MIAGLFGALLLYMMMAVGTFLIVRMFMYNLFDIKSEVSTPVAFIAGILFPVTIVLLFVGLPIAIAIWYVKNSV